MFVNDCWAFVSPPVEKNVYSNPTHEKDKRAVRWDTYVWTENNYMIMKSIYLEKILEFETFLHCVSLAM